MSLRSRRPNNTNVEEQRPELLIPEEKVKVKRNEKTSMKTSQEVKLQNPDEGAKNRSSEETHGGRRGLRSQRLKVSLPNAAGEESVGIHGGNQKEKEGKEPAGFRSLRLRKRTAPPPETAVESSSEASERRVTRGAKRCAENIKKASNPVFFLMSMESFDIIFAPCCKSKRNTSYIITCCQFPVTLMYKA